MTNLQHKDIIATILFNEDVQHFPSVASKDGYKMDLPTIQQLRCLICYSREKNFTRAAMKTNITQSAFSAQIKKLEAAVGTSLIVRSNKESHLTAAGEKMAAVAEKLIDELQQEILNIRGQNSISPSLLKIGVIRSMGDVVMNRHVQYFKQQEKGLDLAVYDMESCEILTDLRDDKIDLASIYMIQEKPFADYAKVHFYKEPMVYYAPCRQDVSKTVSHQDIADYPLVYYPENYFIEQPIRDYFPAEYLPPKIATLSTPYAMVHFCQQNPAGAILPQRFLEALGTDHGIYTLEEPLVLNACIVFKKDNPKMNAINDFTDYLMQCFANE